MSESDDNLLCARSGYASLLNSRNASHRCLSSNLQVPECLITTGASFVAVFCCGPPADLLAVDVALAARRARGVVLLLDDSAQPAARGGCALLRTAAAAAADMLPPVTRVLWRASGSPGQELRPEPAAAATTASQAGDGGSSSARLAGRGRGMHGQHAADMRVQPALSRGAALQAVRAAVEGVLGASPTDDAPLMDAGLASAGAVQLVDALSERIGSDLPGMPGCCPASWNCCQGGIPTLWATDACMLRTLQADRSDSGSFEAILIMLGKPNHGHVSQDTCMWLYVTVPSSQLATEGLAVVQAPSHSTTRPPDKSRTGWSPSKHHLWPVFQPPLPLL